MKSISPELQEHLDAEVTSVCLCWKVTRKDGVVLGFTNHDDNVEFEGVSYQAESGFDANEITSSDDLSIDIAAITGVLDSENISDADIIAGRFDEAEIEIFLVNYEEPTQGKVSMRTGWFGEVRLVNGQYLAELHGLTERLSKTIGELYSPTCRAQLGDNRCKLDLTSFTVSGSLTAVTSSTQIADDNRSEAAGYFNYGFIKFTSGANLGVEMEVKSFDVNGNITLVMPLPYEVLVGDNYELIAGCDKFFVTCKNKFNNVVNFRGEPHIPGTDRMLETASTRN